MAFGRGIPEAEAEAKQHLRELSELTFTHTVYALNGAQGVRIGETPRNIRIARPEHDWCFEHRAEDLWEAFVSAEDEILDVVERENPDIPLGDSGLYWWPFKGAPEWIRAKCAESKVVIMLFLGENHLLMIAVSRKQ